MEVAAWDAAEPALEALEARLDATELALEIAPLAEEPREDAPEAAEEAAPEREEAAPLAEDPAPLPKMVVEPTVVVNVEPPEVSTETMAEVVIAVGDPPAPASPVPVVETPAPPVAPPVADPEAAIAVAEEQKLLP